MRTHKRKAAIAAALLSTGLVIAAALHTAPLAQATTGDGHPGNRDVIVHLFQWPWNSIADECTNVLGPKGFGGVQVSPPQEHVVLPGEGYPWWQDYQPVSYQLVSRRGNRAAFANMVATCRAAGVDVYVDAVLNHMAGGGSEGTGPGSAGSTYTHYTYPAVPYGFDDFHHCGRHGDNIIRAWQDQWEVQNCMLLNLSDLKTESGYVRGRLVNYLNDLVSLGVAGFRVDAAKHVPVGDLQAIYGQVSGNPYIYQEVIEGGPGEISPRDYTGIGDVTEFRYGDRVSDAFRGGNLSNLNNVTSQMLLNSQDAVVFIDNHDTQRGMRNPLTYRDGAPYAMAEAFMLAFPYGTPAVMSSFAFNAGAHDTSPPRQSNGATSPVNCSSSGWVCEHRWRTTANLVELRSVSHGSAVTNWWTNGNNQIAFGRGTAAYVAFNRAGGTLSRTFQTSLPAGTYCDVANGDFTGGSCTGPTYTVGANGQFTGAVAGNGVLALHVGARLGGQPSPSSGPAPSPSSSPSGCTQVSVTFEVNATTVWGENIYVVGSIPALGNWNPANGVPLSAASYPVWRGTVTLPAGTSVQYKYIKRHGSQVLWESDPNRSGTTSSASPCAVTWSGTWR